MTADPANQTNKAPAVKRTVLGSPPFSPLTVSVARAAELVGLGKSTVWKLIADGELETVKIGNKRLVLFASLADLIERRRGNAA
jgi:excisionase family DNA binding protein